MYERIGRPRPYSADRELVLLDRNSGTATDWFRRLTRLLERYHTDPASQPAVDEKLFVLATHPALLKYCWDEMETRPTAPGPDGVRYADCVGPDRWATCRSLSESLRSGAYRPQPERDVPIPKPGNRGHRTITVQSIFDRIVQRALAEVLQLLLDPTFHRLSFGFRPGRDRTHALAAAEYLSQPHKLPVWALADIRAAFDRVPLPRLLGVVETRVHNPDLIALVRRLVDRPGGRGLRQGAPLSPLLLNLYLDQFLDRPWEARYPDTPLLRYADDLLVLCSTWPQARERLRQLDDLLRPTGLCRKEADPSEEVVRVCTLRPATWLGFEVRAGVRGLHARVHPGTLQSLRGHIDEAYSRPNAALHIREAVAGWLGQQGPCFKQPNRVEVHFDIEGMIQPEDLRDIQPPAERDRLWQAAYARWEECRERVRKSLREAEAGGPATAGREAVGPNRNPRTQEGAREPHVVGKVGSDPGQDRPVGPRPRGGTHRAAAEVERWVPAQRPPVPASAPTEEGKALEPRAQPPNLRGRPGEEELAALLALSGKDVRRLALLLLVRDRVKAELDGLLPEELQP